MAGVKSDMGATLAGAGGIGNALDSVDGIANGLAFCALSAAAVSSALP